GNRVLITELGANRVTERTFADKIVWEYKFEGNRGTAGPVLAQRMPNGNTFITTMSGGVIEVNRDGKEVSSRKDLGSLRAAWKYRDGRIAVVTDGAVYRRFDPSGKEEKSYTVSLSIGNSIGGIDFLPGGGLLAVQNDRVIEYDAN